MAHPPQAVIIAGPNGSGKSTAAAALLPPGMQFINADNIAQSLSGEPDTAADVNSGRLLLREVDKAEQIRNDFAFETTLATRLLFKRIARWQEAGYQVHLIFFWLPNDDLAVARVAARVRAGGHGVPEETVRRRYLTGLRHLFRGYMNSVDTWRLYDTSGIAGPQRIARYSKTGGLTVDNAALWSELKERYSS